MTNERLYTNKAMAIGAVIDVLEFGHEDLLDLARLIDGRLVDLGIFGNFGYSIEEDTEIQHTSDDDTMPDLLEEEVIINGHIF